MPFPTRWFTHLVLFLLLPGLFAGCTRDREAILSADDGAAITLDDSSLEPEVIVLPDDATAEEQDTTPTAEPSPTETPEPETVTYRVAIYDTVSTIAEKFGTTSDRIRQINLLSNDNLQVGQVLRVPYSPGVTAEGVPTPTPGPLEYEIKSGDTLGSIAQQFDVSIPAIVAANTIRNQDNLVEGQVIIIPGAQASLPAQQDGLSTTDGGTGIALTHTVASGDTLLSIAIEYDVEPSELIDINNIVDPDALPIGRELIIPGRLVEPPAPLVHVVAAGETFFSIARRYDVDPEELMETNDIANADFLRVGEKLIIPGRSATVVDLTLAPTTSSAAERNEPVIHEVRNGQTILSIARQYDVDARRIIDANRIDNPDVLPVGTELIIPGITPEEAAFASQIRHAVAAGETLNTIARLYGVDVAEIISANDLDDPNRLIVGEILVIP